MNRSHFALLALLGAALLASAPAEAGRPRGAQVLDRDVLSLMPEDHVFYLALMHSASGRATLLDESDDTPMRVTPLGFTPPAGSNTGSYTETPDGSVWAAFSSAQGVRVYDLGDLAQPGALAPVLLQAEPMGDGFDPRQTQMGIIAILIGLMTEPRPAVSVTSVHDGTSNTMMFAWDGSAFEPVVEVGDGTWTWDRPQ